MINNNNLASTIRQVNKIIKDKQIPLEIENKDNEPFKMLVSGILSARTKDETTVKAVRKLFTVIQTAKDLEDIEQGELEKLIYGTGFYKTKARHLKAMAKKLNNEFNGKVPDNIKDLLKLQGVGHKIANLMLVNAFNKMAICVDTHVHRIMNRWGYVNTKNPDKTEMALRKKLPKRYWKRINNILVRFGQNFCRPVNPPCSKCPLNEVCEYGKTRVKSFTKS